MSHDVVWGETGRGIDSVMGVTTSELRVPADPSYIVVAKRAAAGFGAVAGLDVEAIDDLTIAVAQACENAIALLQQTVGVGFGQIRLTFKVAVGRVEIHVTSVCSRQDVANAQALVERNRRAAAREREEAWAATELALRMMGLFVDDFGYRVDERTGALRVRLTKHRAS